MSDFVLPTTRYAVSGEVNIAYQTMGDGPIDIVLVPGIVSHVVFLHEFPESTAFLEARDYPIEYPALRRSKSGWMMFAPSWTTLVRSVRHFWESPKVLR